MLKKKEETRGIQDLGRRLGQGKERNGKKEISYAIPHNLKSQ